MPPSHIANPPLKVHLLFESSISYPIILGIAQAAYELGWDTNFSHCLCLSSLRIPPPSETTASGEFNCDGLLIFGSKQPRPATTFNRPVVTLANCQPALDRTPSVNWDWAGAAQQAADYLLSLNYPHLAILSGGSNLANSQILEEHFIRTCATKGQEVTVWKMPDTTDFATCRDFCKQISAKQPTPCAILARDDQWANTLINVLLAENKSIPNDFAVMGVGNIDYIQELAPVKISTIEMDTKLMGYRAAYMLNAYLKKPGHPPPPCVIPAGRLIERQSTCMIFCKDSKIQNAHLYIRQNFKKPLTAADIAAHCGLTPSELSRKYQTEIGRTPSQELRERRLEWACALLESTNLSLESIAVEAGLGRLTNLWRLFKKQYGIPPGEWRDARRQTGQVALPAKETASASPFAQPLNANLRASTNAND